MNINNIFKPKMSTVQDSMALERRFNELSRCRFDSETCKELRATPGASLLELVNFLEMLATI